MAGAVLGVVNCPIELVKVRLQTQNASKKQYRGIFDCARQIYSVDRLPGLFRGLSITLLRDIPSYAGYFGVYEASKKLLADGNGTLTVPQQLLAGGLAGFGKLARKFLAKPNPF